jgi:putative transposase
MAFSSSKRRKHSKPGQTTMRAFRFLVATNNAQSTKLRYALDLAWELRNDQATILDTNRKEARAAKLRGETPQYIGAFELKKLVAGDQLHPKFGALHSQVRQDLSMRVSEGQKRWFEAIKEGRSGVLPPKPMQRKHFQSITYPQYGTAAHIKNGHLHLSKLGEFRLIGWRKMRGKKKSVTLKFKNGQWWAIVMCEVQLSDVCRPYAEVRETLPDGGADPGLTASLTDSYGKSYETPKALRNALAKLRHVQKDVSRKFETRKKLHTAALARVRVETGSKAPVAEGLVESLRKIPYSNRLRENIKKLARVHTKVERVRDDAAKKNARRVEQRYSRVAIEEHGLMFMFKNRCLANGAADAAIGAQKKALQNALGKGRYVEASNRRPEGGNSQTCLCGASAPKTLDQRWHNCPECGLQGPRDQVSAIICQFETFGTLPQVDAALRQNLNARTPGLGVLEQAIILLKTRRGEGKGRSGESRAAERSAKIASEPSVKRPSPGRSARRKTAGGAKFSSAVAKTVGHAGSTRSWSTEAKDRPAQKTLFTHVSEVASKQLSGSPLIHVGE